MSNKVKIIDSNGEVEEVTSATVRNRARRKRGPRYTFKLNREQRSELFAGQCPRIVVPRGKSPFAPGDVYELPGSSRLWLGITGIEGADDGDVILYVLYDDNPRLLRASPHGVDFEAIRRSFDSQGLPTGLHDPDVIADAGEESAYTTSPGAALHLEKEAVAREVQAELTKETKEERRIRRAQAIALLDTELEAAEADPDFNAEASDIKYMRRKLQKWREEDVADERAA